MGIHVSVDSQALLRLVMSFLLVATTLACQAAGVVSPAKFGAVGDGETDDTRAIQAALDEAGKGSYEVELTPGQYVISGTLVIPNSVTLRGTGPRWEQSSVALVIKQPGFHAVELRHASCVKGVAFRYPNNLDQKTPAQYPAAILLNGINPSVEQVSFAGAWIGISTPEEGGNTGQALFRDINGLCHHIGIRLDGILDIVRIENVHWFPAGPTGDDDYFRNNLTGFVLGRVDGLLMTKCFMIFGKAFVHQLAKTAKGDPAHSLELKFHQCYCEHVANGFLIEGTCGFVCSDGQVLLERKGGKAFSFTMPNLFYNAAITNTLVRTVNPDVVGIEFAPTDTHVLTHLFVSNCQIHGVREGVRLGPRARRVWITNNHILASDVGVYLARGADMVFVRDNIIGSKQPINDRTVASANKRIEGNMFE